MKIWVLIKQVPDTETKIRLSDDSKKIDEQGVKWIINPYDEFAIEEALRVREKLKVGSVNVLNVGPARSVEALRTALAMGADEAFHVQYDNPEPDSYIVSRALFSVLKKHEFQLLFSGKQAIDDDQCAVFGYVSEWLNIPSLSVVVKLDVYPDKGVVQVEQDSTQGRRNVIEMMLPCLVAVNKGINTPRYASLPGIMKAKKKEIKTYQLSDLDIGSETPTLRTSQFKMPKERAPGKKISGDTEAQVNELVRLLREEAKVI